MKPISAELSVIVPFWNEAPNVVPLAKRIFTALANEPRQIEVIFVDDASTDGTWERMLEAQQLDSRVRAVRHLKHGGQSAALWTGFRASRGGVVATLDGDLQNDPADLPAMFVELAGCDLVCGVRTRRLDSWLRRLSSGVARTARKLALGVDFRDTGCTLRVFKRSVLETLPVFNGFHRFMPILAQNSGAVVKEVPVSHHPRIAGQSKYGVWNRLWRGLYDLVGVRWFGKRQLKLIQTVEHTDPREA